MIYETLESPRMTRLLGPLFSKALDWLTDLDFEALPLGKTSIAGEHLSVLKQEYLTQPKTGLWESHREYADIHLPWDGEESFGFAAASDLTVTREYNTGEDYLLYSGRGQFLHLKKRSFLVLFPTEAHMSGIALAEPTLVRKLVFKVAL